MADIKVGELANLLSIIPPSRVSMCIRSLPGRGVLHAVKKVHAGVECLVVRDINSASARTDLQFAVNDSTHNTLIIDLDAYGDQVIENRMQSLMLQYIDKGGQLIIVSCASVAAMGTLLENRVLRINLS